MHSRHLSELQELRREVKELREVLRLVVTTLRQRQEADLDALRRDLERALVKLAHRDGMSLH